MIEMYGRCYETSVDQENRNPSKLFTFWTALIVATLTIDISFSTIANSYAIQTHNLSHRKYVLSQKQNAVDLVQACTKSEGSRSGRKLKTFAGATCRQYWCIVRVN